MLIINRIIRAKDWRYSFVPLIIGYIYLWIFLLQISFDLEVLQLLFFYFITILGFAALGYFINDFFDKEDDLKAGKSNFLVNLSAFKLNILLLFILCIAFLPWAFLPKNGFTAFLLLTEVLLFLLYSIPPIRLKKNYLLSGIIDSLYAYVIPLILSYHTISLFAGASIGLAAWIFVALIFLTGYRNILIHQMNDVDLDKKAEILTLPVKLGEYQTNKLLLFLYSTEILCYSLFFVFLAVNNLLLFIWIVFYLTYVIMKFPALKQKLNKFKFSVSPVYHFTDKLYQLWFPLLVLFMLPFIDVYWLLIIPFHFSLVIRRDLLVGAILFLFQLFTKLFRSIIWARVVRPFLSIIINYPLYFAFRLFGVNLIEEHTSALEYIKKKS